MKKTIYLILCLLAVALTAAAQPRLDKPEYYLGVQGGVLASMMQFTPTVEQSALHPHWGANAGLVFRYAGHKYCGLQVEANWMQRGWNEKNTNYQRTLHYVEVPMLFHLYLGKKFRGFLNLGPQIGYCVAESYTGSPETETGQYKMPVDSPFDWGVAGGLGFYGRSIAGVWQLEARFNYSLGDIYKNSKADWFSRSAHMNLSVNFAWMWEFK